MFSFLVKPAVEAVKIVVLPEIQELKIAVHRLDMRMDSLENRLQAIEKKFG